MAYGNENFGGYEDNQPGYRISDLSYKSRSMLGFAGHDSLLGSGLGENFSEYGEYLGELCDDGLGDGPIGQATIAVSPPPTSPSIVDQILSPSESVTGLSVTSLLLIGGGLALYLAYKKGYIGGGAEAK